MPGRLLVLSNGHGEDLIALRVLQALHRRRPGLEIAVLPLVGEGAAFAAAEAAGVLRRIGPRRQLPSGGFSNQSLRGLLADLGAGVLGLSWRQWRLVRRWGRRGDPVLAVGDLLPLLLAWCSGAPYGFIGTPKSDYTWLSGPGTAGPAALYHRCKGSEWDPWEWALMAGHRCRLVAMRDALTARGLRRHGVDALAPGNPMMDGLKAEPLPMPLQARRRLLLLGGSRMPEALGNLRRLLEALAPLSEAEPLLVLAPCGSRPLPQEWAPLLQQLGLSGCLGRRHGRRPRPGSAAVCCCWWGRGGLRPGPLMPSWVWRPPEPPPSSWWGLACRPGRCLGPGLSSSSVLLSARAACWGERWRCAAHHRSWRRAWCSCCRIRRGGLRWGGSGSGGWGPPVAAKPWPGCWSSGCFRPLQGQAG